ncbi:collagen binding domain-containing protein [Paenibacillus sp. PL91]|uniref:collagen binding domain-containing protein n=1 Tax=Paenibacillus sp. PL91 TaxID=2729538 RepID=UPI00145DBE81|nr:collagen binding domain-containing protein [Paenibacillus sp. PL91]MBC9201941.1 LPXTG cell wall anchor domain-containing protein [Paenibacillus sp. PL91]
MKKRTIALMVAFLLIFQYVNFAGVLKTAEAAGITGNIITKMTLTDKDTPSTVIASVYESVYYVNPDIRVELGQYLTLNYEWALPENHTYKSGDTYTFQLPPQFVMYGGNISERPLVGSPSVGTYKVTNGMVTLTFNEKIEGSPADGTLSFWNYFTEQSINYKTEVPIQFNIGDSITIPIAPKPGTSPITKKGAADKPFNAESIKWTVDVNRDLQKVNDAVVTDIIPEGLTYKPGTLKVYKMDTDTNGVLSNPIPVTPSTTDPTAPAYEMKIELGNIASSYRIVYETEITDITKASFMNTAVLKGNNISNVTAADTVTNTRGKLLDKSGTYDESTQLIDWEIKYNFGEDSIANANLTDLFNNLHELVPGSIKVFPVADPVTGTAGTEIPAADYTIDTNVSSHPNYTTSKNGFKLIFTNPNPITGAYKIKYQTRPTANLYADATINNTVYSETKQSSVSKTIKHHFVHKTNTNANYAARTIDWKVEINADKYNLYDLKFEDTFPAQLGALKLVPGSLVVKQNGVTVGNSVYTLAYDPVSDTAATKGFSLVLPDGNASYTITYTTQYDYVSTTYFSNASFAFTNNGKVIWKETPAGTVKEQTGPSTFTPNKNTQDNGYKKGSYNATDKQITWNIGVNYNSKTIAAAKLVDKLASVQNYEVGSVEVHKLVINSNGTTAQGAVVPASEYSVTNPDAANANTLTVAFNHTITDPYLITFKTSLVNEFIDDTLIKNDALFSGTGFNEKTLHAEVTIPKAGEYVAKTGAQSDDSINWTVYINRGQSTVSGAKINDTPSKKQTLIKQSFKLFNTSVSADGTVNKLGTVNPSEYVLEFTENTNPAIDSDETFELRFLNTISKPYILEYQSIIDAKDGEKVTNTASFTGNGVGTKLIDNPTEVRVALSGAEGNGSVYIGSLKVEKVDADDTSIKLSGASFELTRNSNGKKSSGTTNAAGELEFGNLRYGKYTLKETSAPAGYNVDGTGTYEVTINSSTPLPMPIANKKKTGNLEITKVDKDNNAIVLEGAKFELFNSANVSLGQKTTAANGKITFTGLPYGSYVLKEISAPAGYSIDGSGQVSITINAAAVPQKVENKKLPVILLGSLEVTKVDSANTSAVLAGAKFELFNSANVSLGQKTTGANGKLSFSDLPYGNYVLKEIAAPAGYTTIGNGELNVAINAPTNAKQVENAKILLGGLEVTKVDSDNTGIVLQGAKFELFNSANVSLGQKTTAVNGKLSFTDLPYGNYVLKEISAPAGYTIIGSGEVAITILSTVGNTVTVKNSKWIAPVVTPSPTPTPKPTVDPTATPPVVVPTATPSPTPTAAVTPSPTASPTASPTVSATPAPTSSIEKEVTEVDKPIEGDVEIPEDGTPVGGVKPEHGKVTISPDGKWVYTPNPGYVGKDKFSIIVIDKDGNEEEIFFEIDVEEPPQGGVIATPDVPVLPKTGESSYLLMQLLGFSMIAVGLAALAVKRRKTRR